LNFGLVANGALLASRTTDWTDHTVTLTTPAAPVSSQDSANATADGSGWRAPARSARPSRSAAALALQAHALAHQHFDAAAAAVVNQLAQTLPCERVSLGLYIGARLRIVAISGAADVGEKHNAVGRIAAAMLEALDQRLAIVYPLPQGASPALTLAHQQLLRSDGHAAVYTVPVATRHEVLGALLFERRERFDKPLLEAAKDAAMFAGPLLALKQRADSSLGRRISQALRPTAQLPFASLGGTKFSVVGAAAAVALLATVALALVPSTHRVVAPARVEGAVQQIIAAPVDGFVGAVQVRPGETVKAGQVLMSLDARELALERDKWAAETAQLDKQYREALSKDEAAPIVMARAKLEQAQSQHELAVQQLERSTLRAPMDGIVLEGDFTQAVGMPLKRGQELMTIAPDKGWRIVADVEEQEIALLREGQHAQVLFAALSGAEPLMFEIKRIAPVATQAEGRNVFEVEGLPRRDGAALPTGTRGVARIEAGQSTLGKIWIERVQHAWRRLAWQWLG
jgi:multidrug efflux pump subunit AcrA (membrane-fusion protein)